MPAVYTLHKVIAKAISIKQCFNLKADLARQLLENGKIGGVSTRSRGDTDQPEAWKMSVPFCISQMSLSLVTS